MAFTAEQTDQLRRALALLTALQEQGVAGVAVSNEVLTEYHAALQNLDEVGVSADDFRMPGEHRNKAVYLAKVRAVVLYLSDTLSEPAPPPTDYTKVSGFKRA